MLAGVAAEVAGLDGRDRGRGPLGRRSTRPTRRFAPGSHLPAVPLHPTSGTTGQPKVAARPGLCRHCRGRALRGDHRH